MKDFKENEYHAHLANNVSAIQGLNSTLIDKKRKKIINRALAKGRAAQKAAATTPPSSTTSPSATLSPDPPSPSELSPQESQKRNKKSPGTNKHVSLAENIGNIGSLLIISRNLETKRTKDNLLSNLNLPRKAGEDRGVYSQTQKLLLQIHQKLKTT